VAVRTPGVRSVAVLSAVGALVTLSGCSSGREKEAGEPQENPEGTYSFQWTWGDSSDGFDVQILEVTRLSDHKVVFHEDQRFRARDVNVAAWSSSPDLLLAYSGDVGTATIGPTSNDGDTWAIVDTPACLSIEQAVALDVGVAERLPKC
jgi:hypothetical protein